MICKFVGSRSSVHLSQGLNVKRMSSDFSAAHFGSVSLDNGNGNPGRDVQNLYLFVFPEAMSDLFNKPMKDFKMQNNLFLEDVKMRQPMNGVVMRQRHPGGSQLQQQGVYRNSCYIEHGPRHVTQVTVTSPVSEGSPLIRRPLSTAAANAIFRR